MFDILTLFFHAVRYSFKAIAAPAEDRRTRILERMILLLSTTGTILFVGGIWHMFRFNMRGTTWVYLLIFSAVCWGVAACIGKAHESSSPADE